MDEKTLKLIVVSDLHIVPDGMLSHGLDTTDRLNQCIEFINDFHDDVDFVVFGGDLADHGEVKAYQRLKETYGSLKSPSYLTLGNHDKSENFLEIFGQIQSTETGKFDHYVDIKQHRIIILDSSCSRYSAAGYLEKIQLAWLREKLTEARGRPVIIILHHNFVDAHVKTGNIILKNNVEFANLIVECHPEIRQVISGHIHMTTSGFYRGVPFSTLAGSHYNIEPTLKYADGRLMPPVPRREGPGQIAVILSDEDSTVVHMMNFIDRHLPMAQELFGGYD